MTGLVWMVLGVAGVVAVADWVAVWRRSAPNGSAPIETVLKPLVLVLLIVAALVLDPSDSGQRAWFVVALVLSLAGDVFLLPSVDRFVPGLASFLLAHVAFIVGFVQADRGVGLAAPILFVLIAAVVTSAALVLPAVRRSEPEMVVPVFVYVTVIFLMTMVATATAPWVGIAGAFTFAASDSILALDRFDQHRRWMPTAVMVTYHVAQALLVVSLV